MDIMTAPDTAISVTHCSFLFLYFGAESRQLWDLLRAGCPVPSGGSLVHHGVLCKAPVPHESHMSLSSAGEFCTISYCPSYSTAVFILWANLEGEDLVGIQQTCPPHKSVRAEPGRGS